MRKILPLFLVVLLAACIKDRVPAPAGPSGPIDPGDRKLIHYWNFNGSSLTDPSYTVGGASITIANTYDAVTPGSLLNARNSDDTGSALRVRNPAATMTIKLPTKGYKKPLLSFAAMRTNNGPQENIITYTVDGVNYTDKGITPNVITVGTDWQLFSFDFSGIDSASDNEKFAVKFTFNVGNTATSGNDRYDNITLDAIPMGTPPPPVTDTTDTLIHYWNFNRATADTAIFKLPAVTIGGAVLSYSGAYMDSVMPGSTINVRLNDTAGSALRLRNPAGPLTLNLPTTGYKDIKFCFAIMRTNNGAQQNIISYSVDGTNFITTGLTPNTNNVDVNYGLVKYDFSTISAVNNNPNFRIRIDFGTGGANSSGNDRIDNITVEGKKQ